MCEHFGQVLVTPPGEADEDELFLALMDACKGMGGLEGRNDSFQAGQLAESGHGVLVGGADVGRPAAVAQPSVLRADTGIVEPRGDRVRVANLSVVVCQHRRAGAVKDCSATRSE